MMKAVPSQRHTLAQAAALVLVLGAGGQALAQSQTPDIATLGTVEVTGQSRVQQLQNVPIAMQVLTSEALQEIGATSLGSLDNFIPGLQIDASQPTQPGYTLRGLGAPDFGIGTDSPVGMYINGVYAGKTGGALLNFNDIKRVEVLEGPQGTLFGRNSAAGAISIIQNDPNGQLEASGLVRLGTQGTRHYEALLNLPLNDSTAFRFSSVGEYRDGWVRNSYDGSLYGGEHTWGTRAAVRWSSDDTSAQLTWEHEQLHQKARPIWALNPNAGDLYVTRTWLDPRSQALDDDVNPNVEARIFDGATLRIEHSLPFAELTSITAYRHFRAQNIEDNDGSGHINSYLSTGNIEGNTSWQQEFKLSGHNALVNWVAGLSGYLEHASQDNQGNLNTNSIDPQLQPLSQAVGIAPATPFSYLTGASQQLGYALGNSTLLGTNLLNGQAWQENMYNHGDYKAFALYGDAIWRLSPADNLTTGVRFTHDEKTFSWYSPLRTASVLDGQLGTLAQTYQALSASTAVPAQISAAAAQLLQLTQVLMGQTPYFSNIEFNDPTTLTSTASSSASWNNTSPRLVFDHHLTPDHMLFASWTEGYQAGGFAWNAPPDQQGSKYQPEYVTSYEAGAKGQFKDAGLFYNATAFHYKFSNLQSLMFVPPQPGQIAGSYAPVTSNQQATGVDLGLQWRVDRVWRLGGALEYIDQTYGSFIKSETDPATGNIVNINLTGQPTGTPSVMATMNADARWGIANGQASFGVQVGYKSAQRCNSDSAYTFNCLSTPSFSIGEAQTRVDMRLGWEAPSKKWAVGLIVNNLANKQYIRDVGTEAAQLGAIYAGVTPPRAYLFEISAKL
ncbi:MAG: TonB-dependent receptor [Burkholderiaceae bacterium]|nr:TonB-dependent receptor [Burkholderiaceae bacterium]